VTNDLCFVYDHHYSMIGTAGQQTHFVSNVAAAAVAAATVAAAAVLWLSLWILPNSFFLEVKQAAARSNVAPSQ
jgi:hypothetical protein